MDEKSPIDKERVILVVKALQEKLEAYSVPNDGAPRDSEQERKFIIQVEKLASSKKILCDVLAMAMQNDCDIAHCRRKLDFVESFVTDPKNGIMEIYELMDLWNGSVSTISK